MKQPVLRRVGIPDGADRFRPSSARLRGVLEVTEEWSDWIRGRVDDITAEIGFENVGIKIPGTEAVYLGMWRRGRKSCVVEIQLGKMVTQPNPEDWTRYVGPLIERLKGYRPFKIDVQGIMLDHMVASGRYRAGHVINRRDDV